MSLFLISGLLLSTVCAALAMQGKSGSGPLVHTVFFWLKNPGSRQDREKLLEGLNMLSMIDLVQQSHVGISAPSHRDVVDDSFDCSITFSFNDREQEEAYQTHPDHVRFVEDYQHLWDRVVVYDSRPASG